MRSKQTLFGRVAERFGYVKKSQSLASRSKAHVASSDDVSRENAQTLHLSNRPDLTGRTDDRGAVEIPLGQTPDRRDGGSIGCVLFSELLQMG